ncbi:2-succinyl-5-enolpyruvyl-6-hydroxy-3-cyclohexene-1-carboxylic-acid synthase [Rubrobacter aplysinae]|uniref:2-succinyl-5-enolpyruvyl-6-hydroxy-3- cyclohexene-1-carboxylic-acid synthase n=1 Tax=Rubrobacter aplysinae TaxID=909625 RepID=UPI000ABB1D1D|nr:2-succinyl-5-enolpyruvyl-6-hydroxy-3-cyclohexene-1-carboxylic-acid synthase [Rubrobacter aplysinae]
MITDAPNLPRLWADLLIEELLRSGAGLFCLASGSRSTPLVSAIAANPRARELVLMHYDERGTAFAALGYARATGRPAVWITTSGTAVANGLPAVVEASTDEVPMILLTADRPPELRDTGANQTIDQPGIFGGYPRWSFDLPAPDSRIDPAMVLTAADQAAHRSLRLPPGPVHLNAAFREPLAPTPDDEDRADYLSGLSRWLESDEPYTTYPESRPVADAETLYRDLRPVERGLIVAGSLGSGAERKAALRLAESLGWPLLPDIASGLRLGCMGGDYPNLAAHYDLLLADEKFAAAHAPEAVLHVGGRIVSKRLQQFVSRAAPAPYAVIHESPARFDPDHRVTHNVETGVAKFCDELTDLVEQEPSPSARTWLRSWSGASEEVGEVLGRALPESGEVSEPLVARAVSRLLAEGWGLFLASSMPVRDMDAYARTGGAEPQVATNRGASGIDGTVASAAGFVRGLGRPAVLVIGDLALLHDLNSLAMLRNLPHPLVVVAINNDGGGIFSFLPVSDHGDIFEPYFGTPHGLGFESAAAMFGLHYERPRNGEAFAAAFREAAERRSSTLIEVKTNRDTNLALHRDLQREVSEALQDA